MPLRWATWLEEPAKGHYFASSRIYLPGCKRYSFKVLGFRASKTSHKLHQNPNGSWPSDITSNGPLWELLAAQSLSINQTRSARFLCPCFFCFDRPSWVLSLLLEIFSYLVLLSFISVVLIVFVAVKKSAELTKPQLLAVK
jgi:hypothetical protein